MNNFIYNLLEGNKLKYSSTLVSFNLNMGDFVKVSNFEERFWVEVLNVKGNKITGRVDNYITKKNTYNFNSIIVFNRSNILDFIKKYN